MPRAHSLKYSFTQGGVNPRPYRACKYANEPKQPMNNAMEVATTRPVCHPRPLLEAIGRRGRWTLSDGLPRGLQLGGMSLVLPNLQQTKKTKMMLERLYSRQETVA